MRRKSKKLRSRLLVHIGGFCKKVARNPLCFHSAPATQKHVRVSRRLVTIPSNPTIRSVGTSARARNVGPRFWQSASVRSSTLRIVGFDGIVTRRRDTRTCFGWLGHYENTRGYEQLFYRTPNMNKTAVNATFWIPAHERADTVWFLVVHQ